MSNLVPLKSMLSTLNRWPSFWDDEDLHSVLQHELLPKMMAVITGWLGPESDWEDVYGGEEE